MAIKNFQQLNTSHLRKQALGIAEAGLAALNIQTVVEKNISFNSKKQKLKIKKQEFDLSKFKRLLCLNLGQGSKRALDEVKLSLKDKIVLDIDLSENDALPEMFKEDLVVCIIFDGGEEYALPVLSALKVKGANDLELAVVSKRLEKFQGGNLAKIIYPATCLSLIFSAKRSDVPAIAGGPTVKDEATNMQAQGILKKYNILQQLNINSLKLRETPKEDRYFKNAHNILMLSPEIFLQAARDAAEDLGFDARVSSDDIQSFSDLTASIKNRQCLLGLGLNIKMVLDALPGLTDNEVLLYFSDGAAFIADGSTLGRAKALGLSLQDGANNFFENLGQQIEAESEVALGDFFVYVKG